MVRTLPYRQSQLLQVGRGGGAAGALGRWGALKGIGWMGGVANRRCALALARHFQIDQVGGGARRRRTVDREQQGGGQPQDGLGKGFHVKLQEGSGKY